MNGSKDPMTLTKDLMGDWTGAILAAEVSALAVLKAEMLGLSVLFGGNSTPKSEAQLRAEDAVEEEGFENMPF